ncbi:MAG: glycosyltransferase [Aquabacterium sp.]|uniref:glycosyltransferase n=1 Tax=Aquabacterium sp. TaxID=1872578 RepID=UPI00271DA002|nr:glycosyltransferase [Aquabacterium sp.]MDO9004528.1 glycosyltransferase [Aquabacterium sp.]
MRRIAVVTPILPVPVDKTRGRFIYETAQALSRQATVRVFLQQTQYPSIPGLRPRSPAPPPVGPDFTLPGIDVQAGTYPALPVLSRLTNGWACGRSLLPKLRAFAPDIVIGYWVYPEGAGALQAARQLHCPIVIGALGTDIHVRSGLSARMTGNTLREADAVITVSDAMTRFTVQHYQVSGQKVHTIVNGFNTTVFYPRPRGPLRAQHGLNDQHRLMVYVGRLIEAKGLRELIDAFERLAQRDPGVRLTLIGEGALRDELQATAQQRGMGDKVILTGGLLPQQVAEWMSNAELVVLPSWSEGYPNVLVEALACGCPVVATRVGGIPEIINDSNGVLVPTKNTAALENGLEQALRHPWSRSAISKAMTRTWDDVATETLAVCEQVIANRP